MLLVHTIGARSGREHIVPMRCQVDGDILYTLGSAHGRAASRLVLQPEGEPRDRDREGYGDDPRAGDRGLR
jgi:hypothetical protein